MAEIKIKKKNPVWIWMILLLGIVGVVIYFMATNVSNNITEKVPETTDLKGMNENYTTVTAFVAFIDTENNRMSLDHNYTHDALIKLTEATNAMADEVGYVVKADIDKVKEYAETITKDNFDTTHADNIRRATDILANVLQHIQQAKYPGLTTEAAELNDASSSINPNVLTLDQKDAVKTFFSKAADVLKKMTN